MALTDIEKNKIFEERKRDHIRLALDGRTQAFGLSGFEDIDLIHEALPDINCSDVSIECSLFSKKINSPFFISCMTAGHGDSLSINQTLARGAQKKNWVMGVGSQRKELLDSDAGDEWKRVRELAPDVLFLGNIGVAQLIKTPVSSVEKLVKSLGAGAMVVHLNPLQECFQPEGTTDFRGGTEAISRLCQGLSVPVIVKETGTGLSQRTLQKLIGLGVFAVDVSGLGGTHWGRVESLRAGENDTRAKAFTSFQDWGISTVNSMLSALEIKKDYHVWASGGVRSGVDGAKLLAMGAGMVGVAMPMMKAAIEGYESLLQEMEQLEFELRTAMFCTGCENLEELRQRQVWTRKT